MARNSKNNKKYGKTNSSGNFKKSGGFNTATDVEEKDARAPRNRKAGWKSSKERSSRENPAMMKNSYRADQNTKADNDPSWYVFEPQIALDGGTIITYDRVGAQLRDDVQYYNGDPQAVKIPALMSLHFIPTIGENDPVFAGEASVNIQGLAMWKSMQCKIGKDLNFAHSDLSLYVMAMDSVYMLYAWAQRIYRLSHALDGNNLSVPNAYYYAMGFPTPPTKGLEDYRKALNDTIGTRIANIKVPTDIQLIQRHTWLVSNIFKDCESYKASQYMFTPTHYYEIMDPDADHIDTWCKLQPLTFSTLDDILDLLNRLISKVLEYKWANEIQARLMLTYNNFYTVSYLAGNEVIRPVFSYEVLPQIHNARICGELDPLAPAGYTGDITQDASDDVSQSFALLPRLTWGSSNTPGAAWGHVNYNMDHFLDVLKDDPTIGDNYVATRFLTTGVVKNVATTGTQMAFVPRWYGTEILSYVKVWTMGVTTIDHVDTWEANAIGIDISRTLEWRDMTKYARYLHFEMGPMVLTTLDHANAQYVANPSETEILGNITNIHYILAAEIRSSHRTAVMGEWLSKEDFLVSR